MKPVIGIVSRPVISEDGHNMLGVYEDMYRVVINSGGIPIGVLALEDSDFDMIKFDGLIFQGGDEKSEYENRYLEYAYKNNIPTLGICLGMQTMGEMFEGELYDVLGHKSKKGYVHEVYINKNSKLYDIFKIDRIRVNSRHRMAIKGTNLDVSSISEDGVIEGIEDPGKKFFIGVQWHPESMVSYDKLQRGLFDYFIKVCKGDL